jgi:fumarate hydratase, class II
MVATRTETDSLGSIDIDAARYWGPQTERARRLFRIGTEHFPPGLIRAVGLQKQAAAEANLLLGELPRDIAEPIVAAAREIADGKRDARVSAAGLADRLRHADQHERQRGDRQPRQRIARRPRGTQAPMHPNDHVNRSQSSNDSFPTVMHIAAVEAVQRLMPRCAPCKSAGGKAKRNGTPSSRSAAPT